MENRTVLGHCRRVLAAVTVFAWVFVAQGLEAAEQRRPNILWISCEDISPLLGCYGDPLAKTPHLDALAREGVRYSHAFTTAGVCAPCRSGIITGMYQTTIGTHHMRCEARLPESVQPFPRLLRQAGYYCTNNSKTDYQFKHPNDTWDASSSSAHWRNRKEGQPFFSVFNFTGCHESGISSASKYESVTADLSEAERQDPEALARTLPPYYPPTPDVLEDWKRCYELITAMDAWAGNLLAEVREAGLEEETIVMFWSDHGTGLPRAKRWLYDSGTRIPLIVRIPGAFQVDGQGSAGSVNRELVSSIDFGPTVLNLAGVPVPEVMQGRAFLGRDLGEPRAFVFGARDRMDERYDIIRAVRDERYRYIRNYEPLKPYYQYMNTPEKGTTMQELRRVHAAGDLPPAAETFMAPQKPVEELYDLEADPHEIHNLASNPQHVERLAQMREVHAAWVRETRDLGLMPEPEIVEREEKAGSRYAILTETVDSSLPERLATTAALASQGAAALPELVSAATDADAAVRAWALTGIGTVADPDATDATAVAVRSLKDSAAVVRVAAARAVLRLDLPEEGLAVLTRELSSDAEWVRLQAAIVLDEAGEAARPALSALIAARGSDENKYVVRVANRAVNDLEETAHVVP